MVYFTILKSQSEIIESLLSLYYYIRKGLLNNRNPKGYRKRKKKKVNTFLQALNGSLYTETVGGSTERPLFLNQTLFIFSMQ